MKSTGIIRRIDDLGRIVIPKTIRKELNLNIRDQMEIYVEDENIIFKKYEKTCIFCKTRKNLINYKDKLICNNCAEQLFEMHDLSKDI